MDFIGLLQGSDLVFKNQKCIFAIVGLITLESIPTSRMQGVRFLSNNQTNIHSQCWALMAQCALVVSAEQVRCSFKGITVRPLQGIIRPIRTHLRTI